MATVRYSPKPLSDEQIKRLKSVADVPDEDLDFSDIPDSDDGYTGTYVRGLHYRPIKKQITLRLDANVLDWFKSRTPKGYQTDINRVLQDYISAQDKKAG
jgi:uncharacterized protein (DUF4415 family)